MSKIGLDLRMAGTQHGGIGRYALALAQRIARLNQEHELIIFYRPSQVNEQFFSAFGGLPAIKLVPAEFRHYSFGEQTGFLRLLNSLSLDLVHFMNFNVPLYYRGKFVVTLHDVVHHKLGGAKKSHWLHFLAYKKVIASAAAKASAIITVSEFSKKEIVNLFQVPQEKVFVTYEGASLSTEVSEDYLKRVRQKFYLEHPYFLFVGVLERKKNLINLTRGFDEFLKRTNLNMDLVIVGKTDSHYPEVRYKAQDIRFKNHLVFTDFVSDGDLSALYAGAFAFTTASLYEGFGLPGVEAMRFGLPLVVSNISVFNEVYDNAAVYFDGSAPGDIGEKLGLLATDAGLYEQLQNNAHSRGQLFSWDQTAKETWQIYNKVMAEGEL